MKNTQEEVFLGQKIMAEIDSQKAGGGSCTSYRIFVDDSIVFDLGRNADVGIFETGPWIFAPVAQEIITLWRYRIERAYGSLTGTSKVPHLKTSILSFDVESNGLHGEGFAVGAIVLDANGSVISKFKGRCPIKGRVDPWVEENVLPVLNDLVDFRNAKAMRSAFWDWFQLQKDQNDLIVVADCGYPVENNFLSACQQDDKSRAFSGPYPLHEISSLLLALGEDTDIEREKFIEAGNPDYSYACLRRHYLMPQKHDPAYDTWVSAICALKALKELHRM